MMIRSPRFWTVAGGRLLSTGDKGAHHPKPQASVARPGADAEQSLLDAGLPFSIPLPAVPPSTSPPPLATQPARNTEQQAASTPRSHHTTDAVSSEHSLPSDGTKTVAGARPEPGRKLPGDPVDSSPIVHSASPTPSSKTAKAFSEAQQKVRQHVSTAASTLSAATVTAKASAAEAMERHKATLKSASSRLLSELEGASHVASKHLNIITGYDELGALRDRVTARDHDFQTARTHHREAKALYERVLETRLKTQQEFNNMMLQKQEDWGQDQWKRFGVLTEAVPTLQREEKVAKENFKAAEVRVEEAMNAFMDSVRDRYHQEQVWSDKVRQLSTYGTMGLMAINVLIFFIATMVIEPIKRRRIEENVSRLITDRHDALEKTLRDTQEIVHAAAAATESHAGKAIVAAASTASAAQQSQGMSLKSVEDAVSKAVAQSMQARDGQIENEVKRLLSLAPKGSERLLAASSPSSAAVAGSPLATLSGADAANLAGRLERVENAVNLAVQVAVVGIATSALFTIAGHAFFGRSG